MFEDERALDLHSPTTFHEYINNSFVEKESCNRLIPPSQTLADRLDIGNDAFLLPGMHSSRTAYSTHLQKSGKLELI